VLRKRKADELKGNQAKKAKAEESSQLYIGTQVAAKVDQDWILAVVVNANEIKGKIEIEVRSFLYYMQCLDYARIVTLICTS
jgi:hypothetical protein